MRSSLIRNVLKFIFNHLPHFMAIPLACHRGYWREFKRLPNVFRPKKFSEKIQLRKIVDRDPRLHIYADKVLVKEFVRKTLGDNWIIPTLWHGKKLPPRDQRLWPIPFVVKANHGSGWNIFVRSEAERDWLLIEKNCAAWMAEKYGVSNGEWGYFSIDAQILIEPFMSESQDLPIDYKFWTFNGKVSFIQVDVGRTKLRRQAFYDCNWNLLPIAFMIPGESTPTRRPVSLEKMIAAAEVLAEGFSFVRVDLYEVNDNPLFGEMTFYPGSGYCPFIPSEWDSKAGALW